MTALLNSPVWPVVGMLIGALATIAVPMINKRPNRQQLGQTAYEQLESLAELYREDLETYRTRMANSIQVEGALRAELQQAAEQMAGVREELRGAQAELRAAQVEIRALRAELDEMRNGQA